jgi:uncharacterized surface protein with fasciclin (FAS1) repeats
MKSKKMIRLTGFASVVVAAGLAIGACSSSGAEPNSSSNTPTTAEMTADAPQTSAPAAGKTIVDIAASNPEFSTLASAVKAAGLAETLSGPGPFTVFAPTNAAFEKLPPGTLDALLQPANKDQLTGVLTYHVVPATVMAADVKPGRVTTVNGATFTVSADAGKVALTDARGGTANVVTTDVVASNGVIHVIDAVLLPPTP